MHACIYACVCMCLHTCVYIYIYMYMCICNHINASTCVRESPRGSMRVLRGPKNTWGNPGRPRHSKGAPGKSRVRPGQSSAAPRQQKGGPEQSKGGPGQPQGGPGQPRKGPGSQGKAQSVSNQPELSSNAHKSSNRSGLCIHHRGPPKRGMGTQRKPKRQHAGSPQGPGDPKGTQKTASRGPAGARGEDTWGEGEARVSNNRKRLLLCQLCGDHSGRQ